MPPESRLGTQLASLISLLNGSGIRFVLIGGLALAPYKVTRGTQDIDVLIDSADADKIHAALLSQGYRCLHRSADAGNYGRGDERVDLLYASRPTARQLLAGGISRETRFGSLPIISAEGLIAFKLQALVNDPRRTQDLEDIRKLLANNRATLDMNEIRGYFRLFEREPLLDELLSEIG